MEKTYNAVIELTSKHIKIIVGYYLDNHVVVTYSDFRDISNCIDNGMITNSNEIINTLKQLQNISDSATRTTYNISEAIVIVPVNGLDIRVVKQLYSLNRDQTVVDQNAIEQLISLVKNQAKAWANNEGMELIDVIPTKYACDDNADFNNPPIGVSCRSISTNCSLHYLPMKYAVDYRNAFKESNIIIKRMISSLQCSVGYIGNDKDINPKDYFILDIGAKTSSIGIVNKNNIVRTTLFAWGGDNITERIMSRFNVNELEAERIKKMYGFDRREYNFDPVVTTTYDSQDNPIEYHLSELNTVIKGELDLLAAQINASIKALLEDFSSKDKVSKLPLLIVGGGSQLYGLKDYIEPKIPNDQLILVESKVLGARRSDLIPLLGALVCHHKYPRMFDESHQKVAELTRDN